MSSNKKRVARLAAGAMSAFLSLGLFAPGAGAATPSAEHSISITSSDWKLVGKMEGGRLIPASQLNHRPQSRMADSLRCVNNLERIRVENGNLVTVAGAVCPRSVSHVKVNVEIQRQNNWWFGAWIGAKHGEATSRGTYFAAKRIEIRCNSESLREYRAAAAFEYTDYEGYVYEGKIASPVASFPCEV